MGDMKLNDQERIVRLLWFIECSSPNDPNRSTYFNALADIWQSEFHDSNSRMILNRSIAARQEAIALMTNHDPDKPESLCCLSAALVDRYSLTRSVDDLHRAIGLCKEAISLLPQMHDKLELFQSLVGRSSALRDIRRGCKEKLETAIAFFEGVLDSSLDNDLRARFTIYLTDALLRHFDQEVNVNTLDRIIGLVKNALELPCENDLANSHDALGVALMRRFQLKGDREDGEKAIKEFKTAIGLGGDLNATVDGSSITCPLFCVYGLSKLGQPNI